MKRMLLVEDSKFVAELLLSVFKKFLNIDWTIDAKGAFERLKKERYDLILTNHILLDMDGEDFVRKVRRLFPDIPIAVFTYEGKGDYLIEAGANLILPKPFDIIKLVKEIRRLLGYNDKDEDVVSILKKG